MPNPNRRSTVRPSRPLIPGRTIDTALGGSDPDLEYLFNLTGELKEDAAQIGTVTIPDAGFTEDDLLVFDGTQWIAVDKTALLALSDLTDVILTSPVTDDLLRFDGVAWVNTAMAELLALNDLSDVTLASVIDGNFLVFYDSAWRNQNFTTGKLAVNADHDLDTMLAHTFAVRYDPVTTWYTKTSTLISGGRGWHINKEKTDLFPHGWDWHVDGKACWGIGMDFDTNNAFNSGFGNADMVFGFDYSEAADIIRLSPAEMSTVGPLTCKIGLGSGVGSPAAQDCIVTISGDPTNSAPHGVLRGSFWDSGVTRQAVVLINRHATSRRTMIDFDNAWYLGPDISATGAQSFHLWDQVAAALRLTVDSAGRFKIGTGNPTAFLHLPAGAAGASNAPLKFTAGTNLTTPEAGAMEMDGTELYITFTTARRKILREVITDGTNMQMGTTNGTQIGTGATQKHALWGKTPIVQPTALTAADNTAIDATYDATEQAVVENLRTRLNELETRLTSWGFLP